MSNHFWLALSVAVYLFYVFYLLFKMFKVRAAAVKSGEVDYRYFKTYSSEFTQSQETAVMQNHVANQFQLPPIFMMTVVLLFSFKEVSFLMVLCAWAFVLARFAHSYVHLGSNKLLTRAKIYVLGWFIVFALWVQVLIHFYKLS